MLRPKIKEVNKLQYFFVMAFLFPSAILGK